MDVEADDGGKIEKLDHIDAPVAVRDEGLVVAECLDYLGLTDTKVGLGAMVGYAALSKYTKLI